MPLRPHGRGGITPAGRFDRGGLSHPVNFGHVHSTWFDREGLPANRGKEGLMQELPTIQPGLAPELSPAEIAALSEEVRVLAAERNAVILAHNYEVPEIQDVADHRGDSLGLFRAAAAT